MSLAIIRVCVAKALASHLKEVNLVIREVCVTKL